MDKLFYIAYGSNINLQQMARRCPNSEPAGTAMLNGYELQFRYHATITPNKESKVPVLLWSLDKCDESSLDIYEGYPNYYGKEYIPIELNGEIVDAMVYIMNGDQPLMPPSKGYYEVIEEGYRENGLDTSFLKTALDESVSAFDPKQDNRTQLRM